MRQTQETLWQTLRHADLVQGEMPAKNTDASPWYIKLLLGFSGWLAALFLMGFIGLSISNIWQEPVTVLIISLVMIGVAYVILRSSKNDFAEHLALAISLAGQGLGVFALFELVENDSLSCIVAGIVQMLLMVLIPNYLHRIFSSFCAAMAFYLAMITLNLPFVFASILLLAAAWIWLHEFEFPKYISTLQPIGYGMVFALLIIKGTTWFAGDLWDHPYDIDNSLVQPWVGEALLGMVGLAIVWKILRRYFQILIEPIPLAIFAGFFLICLVSLEARGITVGVAILVLGFANSNRILMGLGILSLLTYISTYYYLLDTTLLNKSISLLLIGVVLLMLRWLVLKFISAQGGK